MLKLNLYSSNHSLNFSNAEPTTHLFKIIDIITIQIRDCAYRSHTCPLLNHVLRKEYIIFEKRQSKLLANGVMRFLPIEIHFCFLFFIF